MSISTTVTAGTPASTSGKEASYREADPVRDAALLEPDDATCDEPWFDPASRATQYTALARNQLAMTAARLPKDDPMRTRLMEQSRILNDVFERLNTWTADAIYGEASL